MSTREGAWKALFRTSTQTDNFPIKTVLAAADRPGPVPLMLNTNAVNYYNTEPNPQLQVNITWRARMMHPPSVRPNQTPKQKPPKVRLPMQKR